MKTGYNRCLFTRLPGKKAPVHPAVGLIMRDSLAEPICKELFIQFTVCVFDEHLFLLLSFWF